MSTEPQTEPLTLTSLLDPALKTLWKQRRWGQPAWLAFEKGFFETLWHDYDDADTLPEPVLEALKAEVPFTPIQPVHESLASDGTLKLLFESVDGHKFETVLMKYSAPNKPDRYTVCVSSQVGCPARCVFCSTATMKWSRNLRTDEILAQVMWCNRHLRARGARVNNLVFMGMGEPLLNYDNVKGALDMLLVQRKFGMGPRHITVSTVGIIPGIQQMIADKLTINLAVSLHAPSDQLRSQIIPINKSYPLPKLFAQLDEWTNITGKEVFYQYVMLKDRNDGPEQILGLADWLKDRPARLNLIPYNPGPSLEELDPTEREQIYAFAAGLREHDIHVLIRHTFGQDIAAACGQLVVRPAQPAV